MTEHTFSARLTLVEGYRFEVGVDGSKAEITVDEAAPIGEGAGPNPARLVATAVGHCLASSLLFCLRKGKVDVAQMTVEVNGTFRRTERGRLRLGGLSVRLAPDLTGVVPERIERCLELFEDYCIVTESLRNGIPIDVEVTRAEGAAPK